MELFSIRIQRTFQLVSTASGFFPCRKLYTLSFLKIFTHKAVENYLFAYASVAFQDDFSVLPDCFRKTCFCD